MNKNNNTEYFVVALEGEDAQAIDAPDTWALVIDWMQDLDTEEAEICFNVDRGMMLEVVELVRVGDQLHLALPDGRPGTELPAEADPLDLLEEIVEQEARSW